MCGQNLEGPDAMFAASRPPYLRASGRRTVARREVTRLKAPLKRPDDPFTRLAEPNEPELA